MLRAPHVCFVVLMASRFVFGQDFDFAEYKSSRHEKPQLQQQWKKAKSSSDKDKIQKDLMKLVSKKFDEDMQDRQRQIAAIEKRLERLRQLYKKRQNAKPKIVELQTTAIIMDWDGLGFAPQGSRLEGVTNRIEGVTNRRYAGSLSSDADLVPVDPVLPDDSVLPEGAPGEPLLPPEADLPVSPEPPAVEPNDPFGSFPPKSDKHAILLNDMMRDMKELTEMAKQKGESKAILSLLRSISDKAKLIEATDRKSRLLTQVAKFAAKRSSDLDYKQMAEFLEVSASLYEEAGDAKGAQRLLTKALKIDPEKDSIRSKLEQLAPSF